MQQTDNEEDKVGRMVLDGDSFRHLSFTLPRLTKRSPGVQDSNVWFGNTLAPASSVGDVDAALNNFFTACFDAGPDDCAIWSPHGTVGIQSYFFEADRRIQQRPIILPQAGLFEYPQWRYAAYGALFEPSSLFQILGQLTAEVYEGVAGDIISQTMIAQNNSGRPDDPPLVDPETGYSNAIESLWSVQCLDHGLLRASAATPDPEAVFQRYRTVSEIGRNNAYFEIICNSKSAAGAIYATTDLHTYMHLEFPVKSKDKLPGQLSEAFYPSRAP